MATTVQQILDRALARSSKNDPTASGTFAQATEGVQVVCEALQALFQLGTRINPAYFGLSADVAPSGGSWLRPIAAELIYLIQIAATGATVRVVPLDDRTIAGAQPAVYRWGRSYHVAVAASGPQPTDDLTFFYAGTPDLPSAVGNALTVAWPEKHNDALECEVAIRAAIKDGRLEEVNTLRTERDLAVARLIAFLEHEDVGEIQRFATSFNTPTVLPITSLLAGGTNLMVRS